MRMRYSAVAALASALAAVTIHSASRAPDKDDEPDIKPLLIGELQATYGDSRIREAIEGALASGKVDDARDYARAATLAGREVPDDLAIRISEEDTVVGSAIRNASSCGKGFVVGTYDDMAGLACSVGSDFTLVGDLRDASLEIAKIARGEEPSTIILGLAIVGIALEGATIVSGGTTAGAKVGTSVLKASVKSASVSGKLLERIKDTVNRSIDLPSPAEARDLLKADAGLLRQRLSSAVSTDAFKPIIKAARDLSTIRKDASLKDTLTVIRHAESFEDINGGRRIAKQFGADTSAVVKTLGTRALRLAAKGLYLTWQIVAMIASILISLLSAMALMWRAFVRLHVFGRRLMGRASREAH